MEVDQGNFDRRGWSGTVGGMQEDGRRKGGMLGGMEGEERKMETRWEM